MIGKKLAKFYNNVIDFILFDPYITYFCNFNLVMSYQAYQYGQRKRQILKLPSRGNISRFDENFPEHNQEDELIKASAKMVTNTVLYGVFPFIGYPWHAAYWVGSKIP